MIGIAQNDVIAIHAALSRYVSDMNYMHSALVSLLHYHHAN